MTPQNFKIVNAMLFQIFTRRDRLICYTIVQDFLEIKVRAEASAPAEAAYFLTTPAPEKKGGNSSTTLQWR